MTAPLEAKEIQLNRETRRPLVGPAIVALFAVAFAMFGHAVFHDAGATSRQAHRLKAVGLSGTVTDARVLVHHVRPGQTRAYRMELTFTGADGASHRLTTSHFPTVRLGIADTQGWYSNFDERSDILGQPVTYTLGTDPAVELDSELAHQLTAGWGFLHYLGLAFMGMSIGAAIIAVLFYRRGPTLKRT